MNEHIFNAMSMIASAHRDIHFKFPLTTGDREQAENKLRCALGDLAYYSKTYPEPRFDREQREAARWPIIPHQHQAPPSKEALARMLACGSFLSNPHGFRRPQIIEQCNAMTRDQCKTCYEVNDRDCCGYEDRMAEREWATEEAVREPREAK